MSCPVSTICSVGHPSTSFMSAHYQVLSGDAPNDLTPSQECEIGLAQVGLDNASFSNTLVKQITDLQASFKEQRGKLSDRIQGLITTQGTLQQQLITTQTQSERDLAQRNKRITELETQNKQIQDEMAKLIAEQAEKNKRMQKLIDDTNKDQVQTLATKKASGSQNEQSLRSRIQSLETDLNALQPKHEAAEKEKTRLSNAKVRLERQVTSLTATKTSLQKTAREEPIRQQDAVKAKMAERRQAILNTFDRDIGTYTIQTAIAKAKLPTVPESDIGNCWQARITAPDGKLYNPASAAWTTEKARTMAMTNITE